MLLQITHFLGRFHPLVVHLPIGFLLLAFIFECLGLFERTRKLRKSVLPTLVAGALFAMLSTLTGLALKEEGGYEEHLLQNHQVAGITTTILCFVVLIVRWKSKAFFSARRTRQFWRVGIMLPLVTLLSLTGHYGGALTHGEDFLFGAVKEETEQEVLTTSIKETDKFYDVAVRPILQQKCYSCHSAKRQKGQLRLDDEKFLLKGGKHPPLWVAGNSDSSLLISRLLLPPEHKEHMPPKEKPQLTNEETEILKMWIDEGADFNKTMAELPGAIALVKGAVEREHTESWLPIEEVDFASESTLEKLREADIQVLPIASGSPYLSASFVNARSISNEALARLSNIGEQLVALDLSFTTLNDDHVKHLLSLENIRVLNLRQCTITDRGLLTISTLPNLQSLNLAGTQVTDDGITSLAKSKQLKKVFLFQTKASKSAIIELQKAIDGLTIDTGNYRLPVLATDTIRHKRKI